MLNDAKRLAMAPWMPMGFCAALSLITVVAQIAMTAVNGPNAGSGWSIAFLCFLPICFFFVGTIISQLQGEIR